MLILGVNTSDGQSVFLALSNSDSGLQVEESFPAFIDGFDQLAMDNPGPELFVAAVHFTPNASFRENGRRNWRLLTSL